MGEVGVIAPMVFEKSHIDAQHLGAAGCAETWVLKQTACSYFYNFRCPWQGWWNWEYWGDIAPPIFLEGGKILAFSNPNISALKEGVAQRIH